jgi:hypothetical protein
MTRKAQLWLAAGLVLLLALAAANTALAATPAPSWSVKSIGLPTNFTTTETPECENTSGSSDCDGYFVTVTNVGSVPSSGTITIKDVVPQGMEILKVPSKYALAYTPGEGELGGELISCGRTTTTATCSYESAVPPAGVIEFFVAVSVTGNTGPEPLNQVEVEGGGANPAKSEEPGTEPTPIATALPEFGVQNFTLEAFGPSGERDLQAGDHPSMIATGIAYNTVLDQEYPDSAPYDAVREPKSEIVNLPIGFIGNALSAPRCSEVALAAFQCPADTRVGVVGIFKGEPRAELLDLYNVTPENDYPAQFGFNFLETVVMMRPRLLPSANGYVLSVSVPAVPRPQGIKVREVTVAFFGDPSLLDGGSVGEAFATDPVGCGGPASADLELNSWEDPSDWQSAKAPMFEASKSQGVTGCDALQFNPTIQVAPTETTQADTPSGYEVNLHVPQTPNFEGDLASADLKNAVVTLPAGVSVSPGAANGLVACQASGPEGIELGNHDAIDADKLAGEGVMQEGEEIAPDELVHAAPGHCPLASQIGDVEVATPLLEEHLKGHVYIAAPGCGGPGQPACTPQSAEDGELFGIYLEVGSAASGVHIKLKGNVSVNPSTGQLTTTFAQAPQLPFSELKLELNGGPRAPLANPQSCGTATTSSDLTPWSTPYTPDATPISSFPVTGCTGAFAPSFTAGTVSPAAGTYSPFTLTFSRHDGEQDLSGLTVNMPEGLIGKVAGFEQCPEAAANAGTCSAASRVGTATAAAGAGSSPYWQSGPVYLTGPYNGAPFGLAVVVPADAGPYHLGNIVVRAAIHINPSTAQVTVVSNPLPQMIDGVPLRVKTVNVTVGEGDDFTFNPTGCESKSIGAAISSAQGATANVSSPFAASGCASLPFKPVLSASTVGKASKAGGASLDVKVAYPSGPVGTYANIKSVKVDLPKQLPSRLTTLQKACLAKVFEANPANCPSAADVGTATATTPLLNVSLSGPAYLVSHGNEAFPDLEIVLQGEGVQIVLDGNTDIKKGITSSTFKSIPDAPVSGFELKLPTGKFSILGSNVPEQDKYSLCGQTLNMPTAITGQNGAVLKQTTKLGVTGCPKVKKAKAKKASRKHRQVKKK